jgi:hypothetical protein
MFIPSPSMMPLAIFENIDTSSLDDLQNIKTISGGVSVYGPAAAYALVWELGSLRLKKPGPRTVWGTNRDGDRRIMSSQAPAGYVGIISNQFWPIIDQELRHVDYGSKNVKLLLEIAVDNASQKIAQLIRDNAPVGETGDLRAGIQGIDSGEVSDLKQANVLSSSAILLL